MSVQTGAQSPPGVSSAGVKRLDTHLQEYIDRKQVAGIVCLLTRCGQVVHTGSYGYLDLGNPVQNHPAKAMRPDAIFRIFSMTKPITSLAVLMLLEEGHFQLDTPIADFIPLLGDMNVLIHQDIKGMLTVPIERPITIFDLLTHTSGLGYGLDPILPVDAIYLQAKILRTDESMQEKIPRIASLPLHHQPGDRYTYSIATDILGHLVEILSGMPLDEFFRRRIFQPLGMVDTGFYVPSDQLERLAGFYSTDTDGGLIDLSTADLSDGVYFLSGGWIHKDKNPRFLSGGGGLVSTAADYYRFAQFLLNQGELDSIRLVKRSTIQLMTTTHLDEKRFMLLGFGQGFGLTVLVDPQRAQIPGNAGSFGAGGAANTSFWVDPRRQTLGVLMTQYTAFLPLNIGTEFIHLGMGIFED